MKIPKPSHREAIALFRQGIVGDLVSQELHRGELKDELQRRAQRRYRPPGALRSRRYSWRTLERWYYAARRSPKDLQPVSRQRGQALSLTQEQRQTLLDMRREHPSAPADLILSEAVRHGIVADGKLSLTTLRRLFRAHGLSRTSANRATRRQRRRWQVARPGLMWHADVCHVVLHPAGGPKRTMYVFGLLDDNSRAFVALQAREHERDEDLLLVLCSALLQHPRPDVLFVDNGSCFRAQVVAAFCQRLGIRLVHAQPYDPEARGKMERVWRTMRQRCTDHLAASATQHDVNLALCAWLDHDYHQRPHAALFGKRPLQHYVSGIRTRPPLLTAAQLAQAMEVHETRKVRNDGTFSVQGRTYEVVGSHLAGRTVDVVIDPLTSGLLRVTCDGRSLRFGACDPIANHRRRRAPTAAPRPSTTPFDPITALLQRARQENPDA